MLRLPCLLLLLSAICALLIPAASLSTSSPTLLASEISSIINLKERDARGIETTARLTRDGQLTYDSPGCRGHDSTSFFQRVQAGARSLSTLHAIKAAYLPAGWPHTVPPEYLKFQFFNCLQDACSYLRNIMSMSAVLKGMGVGSVETTATAATVLWVLRDGAGMLGSLLFASFASVKFGQNAKQWRLFADAINNLGITLEVLAPMFSSKAIFLAVLSLASICKALCGVAAGATNASIMEYWGSTHGNFGDIAAKNGMQHTTLSLLCLCVSVPFIKFTGSLKMPHMWAVYLTLTVFHMCLNFQAMRLLALRSLNCNRLMLLVQRFMHSGAGSPGEALSEALSTREIAKVDPLIPVLRFDALGGKSSIAINYWSSLDTLTAKCTPEAISSSLALYSQCGYFLVPRSDARGVVVCMREKHTPVDTAKSIFEAMVVKNELQRRPTAGGGALNFQQALELARLQTDARFTVFWALLSELGWDTSRLQLQPRNAVTIC